METARREPKRVLVVRLGAIGDALRVLPAVRRLRVELPQATIGWAVEDWVYPILRGNPNVDRFHLLSRAELRGGVWHALAEARRLRAELRSAAYDTVLDFHGRLKSGFVSLASGAPVRIGYARGDGSEGNHLFSNVHVRLEDRWENRVVRFLHLLEPLGIEPRFDISDTGVHVDHAAMASARAWFEKEGRPALALYPGTSMARASYGRWPREKWVALLQRTAAAGISSVVFWGPDDESFARDIAAAAGSDCRLAPPTTLPEMMAMLSQFHAFLGSNTAAMHMAWLQRVPTGVFLGPARPRTDTPFGPVPCRLLQPEGAFREGARKRHQSDVTAAVSVDAAFAAVQWLLERRAVD